VARAAQPFPVLLFAPGSGVEPLEYAGIIEDVVSRGWVVAGITPTHYAGFTIFDDGRVEEGHEVMPRAAPAGQRPTAADAIRRYDEAAGLIGGDLSFALGRLTMLGADAGSPFAGRLDLSRVGAFGHSLGGGAAVRAAHDDPRIRAVFDIDGSPIWTSSNGALGKPLLLFSASSTSADYDALLRGARPAYHLILSGSVHSFSTDTRLMPFLNPVQVSEPVMGIEPSRALKVTAAYIDAFFAHVLRGAEESMLTRASPDYPEIIFDRSAGAAGGARP